VDGSFYDWLRNAYSIPTGYNYCRLAGKRHDFELPERKGITLKSESEWKGREDVYGCGLLLDTKNDKCFIFFTKNGTLMGQFPRAFDQKYRSSLTQANNWPLALGKNSIQL
jgi:hypothetical protein